MDAKDQALVALGQELQACCYRFTTITPLSHQRVNSRRHDDASPLERVFGWSRSFHLTELPSHIVALLDESGELVSDENGALRSAVRFSTLGEQIFVHSAFPTNASDSVFFGPDTYRFARALRCALPTPSESTTSYTVIDIGCGSGAGGLFTAGLFGEGIHPDIILSDVNPKALRYSQVNAALNCIPNVRTMLSDVFSKINEGGDLVISNPPYLVDKGARAYRHGGGTLGFELALRIIEESLDRLHPGGRLFLYMGAPVINGTDQFLTALRPRIETRCCRYSYEEIDPDVFGEELDNAPYDRVDRIAVVALTIDI
jgi:release factor glutamine methyltransferase